MDFNTQFPFSSVYKMTKNGLSLYTQEYMQKFLSEEDMEKKEKKSDDEDGKESKEKYAKKSDINLEPKDEVGEY